MLRTIRALASAFVAAASLAAPLFAAAPVFSNNFTAVTLDGVRLGTDTDPSNFSEFPSVVYDPSSGLFHMWVANTSVLSIEGLRHATSSDGVHFISDGNLSFAGGSPFPAYGANTEPQFEFPRAAKIGSDWKLLIWTENNPSGAYGDYNYNESVNDIGVDPSTLAVTHQGPVFPTDGSGTFGQTTGPYGIVNGKLYVEDDRIGGLSKWEYNDAAPPSRHAPGRRLPGPHYGDGLRLFPDEPGQSARRVRPQRRPRSRPGRRNARRVLLAALSRRLARQQADLLLAVGRRRTDVVGAGRALLERRRRARGRRAEHVRLLASRGHARRNHGAFSTSRPKPPTARSSSRRARRSRRRRTAGRIFWAAGRARASRRRPSIGTSDGGYAVAGHSCGF